MGRGIRGIPCLCSSRPLLACSFSTSADECCFPVRTEEDLTHPPQLSLVEKPLDTVEFEDELIAQQIPG